METTVQQIKKFVLQNKVTEIVDIKDRKESKKDRKRKRENPEIDDQNYNYDEADEVNWL